MANRYYHGPLFPDHWGTPFRFWGPHFPDPNVDGAPIYTGQGPAGVATFLIDGPTRHTMAWATYLHKMYDGSERRESLLDLPRSAFEGRAMLVGPDAQEHRAAIARYMAPGSIFRLALPFDDLIITADAIGAEIPVSSGALALADWAQVDRRVVIKALSPADGSMTAVIQAVGANSITIGSAPGAIGKRGGRVIPTVAVLLDSSQEVERTAPARPVELWSIAARQYDFGYPFAGTYATLALSTVTGDPALAGMVVYALEQGTAGNDLFVYSSYQVPTLASGALVEVEDLGVVSIIRFTDGATAGDVRDAFAQSSTVFGVTGDFNPALVLDNPGAIFGFSQLAGGVSAAPGQMGRGATITTFANRPVFDRPLHVKSSVREGVIAGSVIIDLGGVLATDGSFVVPDWTRSIAIDRPLGLELQWLRKFLATVRGRHRSFLLPTWGEDLTYVSTTGTGIRISATVGNFTTWYPIRRKYLQLLRADGTVVYAKITGAVLGVGVYDLTLDVGAPSGSVARVSWMDVCRFEDDKLPISFSGRKFMFTATARVIQDLPPTVTSGSDPVIPDYDYDDDAEVIE